MKHAVQVASRFQIRLTRYVHVVRVPSGTSSMDKPKYHSKLIKINSVDEAILTVEISPAMVETDIQYAYLACFM
jgi:hypothetical protein